MNEQGISYLEPPPHALLQLLRTAIDEDSFVVSAEPIVDLAVGELCKHGLALELSAGDGRLIGPSSVDAVAARFGLTTQLDDLLIRRAVGLAADGQAVAVHLHTGSLDDPGLARRTAQAVLGAQVDPADITFELAEDSLVTNANGASAFVARMHDLGCRVTADHFGIGSAGFGHLKRIPIDCLKIDPGFIVELRTTPSDEQFVRAFVHLADGLGIESAADGVRDEATQQIVADAGVGQGQGPLFGAPVPVPPGGLAELVAPYRANRGR